MKSLLLLVLGTGSLLAATASSADDGFRIYQDCAPEFVRVEIGDVQVDEIRSIFSSNRTRVRASGRVIEVIRSATGLTPGSVIEIQYDHLARGGSSAETPPILQHGTTVPAFLSRKGGHYTPAAHHHSFSEPTSAQMKRYDQARIQSQEAALIEVERHLANPNPRPVDFSTLATDPTPRAAEPPVPPAPTAPEPTAETLPLPTLDPTAPPVAEGVESADGPRDQPVMETAPPAPVQPEPARAEIVFPEPKPHLAAPIPTPDPVPAPAPEPITPLPVTLPPARQSTPVKTATSTLDEVALEGYAAIYSLIKKGEAAQLEGKREAAREAYVLAREKLLKLKAEQPDFQPFMVEYRLKDLKKRLEDPDRFSPEP